MKENKTNLITKKELNSPNNIVAELRRTLLILRLKQRAGQLPKTHNIKKIRKEIARNLTKKNQQKAMVENESGGGEA